MSFLSDPQRAQIAFQNATEQARRATNDIFNQFGLTRYNPSTGWTTANAASSFSPNNIVDTSGSVATIKQGQLDALASGKFGTSMGYGRLADVMGQASDNEYAATQDVRNRGLGAGKSGLVAQARAAAESNQGRAQANVGKEVISALGQTYGDYGTSFNNFQEARINAAGEGGNTQSEAMGGSTAANSASSGKPTNPGTRMYQRKNGYQWLGAKKGWVKSK